MKTTQSIIKEIEIAFNKLVNDSIKKGSIGIEELKNLVLTPSPSYQLLHVFSNNNIKNRHYLNSQQHPIGSINISKCNNTIQIDTYFQNIATEYNAFYKKN